MRYLAAVLKWLFKHIACQPFTIHRLVPVHQQVMRRIDAARCPYEILDLRISIPALVSIYFLSEKTERRFERSRFRSDQFRGLQIHNLAGSKHLTDFVVSRYDLLLLAITRMERNHGHPRGLIVCFLQSPVDVRRCAFVLSYLS